MSAGILESDLKVKVGDRQKRARGEAITSTSESRSRSATSVASGGTTTIHLHPACLRPACRFAANACSPPQLTGGRGTKTDRKLFIVSLRKRRSRSLKCP